MNFQIIIVILIVAGFVALAYLQSRKKRDPGEGQGLIMIQSQINELIKTIDAKLGESRQEMSQTIKAQFDSSQKFVNEINKQVQLTLKDVTKEQTKTNESTQQFLKIAE